MIRWAKDRIKHILQRPFNALLANSARVPGLASPVAVAEQAVAEKAAAQIRSDPSFPARYWPRYPGQTASMDPKSLPPSEIDRVDRGFAVLLSFEACYVREQSATGLHVIEPAGKLLCDRVDITHFAFCVGRDHGITQAVKSGLKSLPALCELAAFFPLRL